MELFAVLLAVLLGFGLLRSSLRKARNRQQKPLAVTVSVTSHRAPAVDAPRHAEAAAAERPPAPLQAVPYEKEIVNGEWTLWSGERVLVDNIALNVRLRYRNWSHETDRSVTVQAIIGRHHRDGEVSVTAIGGYCQLRRATRQFRLQNIVFCVDPVTGETIPALGEWIMRQAGRTETVRPLDPAWNEGPEAREVEPTVVELELDLSRGRGQAVERFTVEIYSIASWGHAFEGIAKRHKAPGVRAWKGRKRFQLGPDGSIRLSWMEHDGKRIDDIAAWLAALPNASVSTRTPPPGRIDTKPL